MSSSSDAAPHPTTGDAAPAPLRVVVATGNRHKVDEISSALGDLHWEFVSVADLGGWDAPEETGETF